MPLLRQAFDYIKASKSQGVSGSELGRYLGQSRLLARTLIRNLERMRCISSYTCNEGRQKLQRLDKYFFSNVLDIFTFFTHFFFQNILKGTSFWNLSQILLKIVQIPKSLVMVAIH